MTKNSYYSISSELSFKKDIENDIQALWQSRTEGHLQGKDRKNLYWISLTSPSHSKAVVIVNGRVETVWKYQELFYDFYRNGYDVYSFDHRGQGLSDRLLSDIDAGHVDEFSDYVDDMELVVEHFQLEKYQKRFVVAHSMGGAVATRYFQSLQAHKFDALALSAPMYGVNIAWYLKPISVCFMKLKETFQSKPYYGTSHKQYESKPFEDNPLSHSETRYQWFRKLYNDKPELQVGGASSRWIWQGLTAAKRCIRDTEKLTIPLLLLQGSEEAIVSNQAQNTFFQKLRTTNHSAQMEIIQGARHEILFEKDNCRNIALTKVFSFFDKF
ncbi:alpha/beta fold hydrolase [Vibrio hannami]|uniref:alpha/beta fold hydrolase n=1 Tax=Vibrio hannami TaxID=2717094 RepID=UPI00240FFA23|nr:alpha/beta fold hydrolase [Vibrio hannami]MDG3086677.1 alpha/beta fold hydrolase [Vibrio hannami]